jgi:hypothetical protein
VLSIIRATVDAITVTLEATVLLPRLSLTCRLSSFLSATRLAAGEYRHRVVHIREQYLMRQPPPLFHAHRADAGATHLGPRQGFN